MENEISRTIRNYISENFMFNSTDPDLKETDSFLENGIIDSTGILELIAYLEEKYGIEVKDEEIVPENLDCIKSIVGFIQRKIGKEVESAAS